MGGIYFIRVLSVPTIRAAQPSEMPALLTYGAMDRGQDTWSLKEGAEEKS